MSFTKLFSSLLDSTLWVEQPLHVRVVWVAMMAMADKDGFVAASIPGLARRACVTTDQAVEALTVFLAPDRYSRTPDHEGRRIQTVMGGWVLLNYATYRKRATEDMNREKRAQQMRERRAQLASESDPVSPSTLQGVTDCHASASSSPSASGSDPDPGAPTVPEPETIRVDRRKGRFAPADFAPTELHRVRMQELRLDPAALLRAFKDHEFNREYSDWERRFSKWIEDERLKQETERARAAARIPGIRSVVVETWEPEERAHAYRKKHHIGEHDWAQLLADQRAGDATGERSLRERHRVFGERLARFCRERDAGEARCGT